ncbi:MAG: LPS assembly lipoprotein LptE [Rhodocyclaceae bacterium]|nr:LPS assembly lipoprotein LptE [Rhodocyclaceae bacterium]
MRRLILIVVVLALSSAVGGCGFKLRGAYTLPFDTLYIAFPNNTPLYAVLKRNIEASSQTRVVADKKGAEAAFTVVADVPQKIILSLDTAGNVAEYQLVRSFSFRVVDGAERELIPTSTIAIHRDITFNNAQVLSKESEEALLWRDIENDLVQQVLRRLAAAKVKLAADQ